MNKKLVNKVVLAGLSILAIKIVEHVGDYIGNLVVDNMKGNNDSKNDNPDEN